MDLNKIQKRLREFASDRDWEQFHDPKNLTMALSVEVSELLEIFQWSKDGGIDEIKDEKIKKEIEREIADVFNYIIRLSDILDIDIEKAAHIKIDENEIKYPVEKFKGSSRKYNK
jgi:NTP pyrophosphatase (non-canonical NTP hydrolase)|tara:strand:- start:1085 stop:1429 length:345 start_codon:yes stop_codon:yes gene_type:complete